MEPEEDDVGIEPDKTVCADIAPAAGEDPFAAFGEWDGAADRKAYAGL